MIDILRNLSGLRSVFAFRISLILMLLLGTVGPANVRADIRLPKLFSDSMVLQRQAEIPVWGLADADEELTLSISGDSIEKKELKTVCDKEGRFQIKLPSLPVGGPYELEIVGASSTVRIRDILVGDVWLCSGQSNMEMTVAASEGAQQVADSQPDSQLRLLTIEKTASPRPLDEFTGAIGWQEATAEHAGQFSAVGYYFAREIRTHQKVPVGIINASWGGTLCEAWVSQSTLQQTDSLKALFEYGQANQEGLQKQDHHSSLFNGMIAPLQSFPIKGVLWYQGESNVGRGAQYADLFPALIADWRKHFQSAELPFLFVQLAPFRYQNLSPQALAEVWDAQLKTLLSVPNTGMAVTTDLGNKDDIHPTAKQPVAQRLAWWALAEVYNDESTLAYPDHKPHPPKPAPETGDKDDALLVRDAASQIPAPQESKPEETTQQETPVESNAAPAGYPVPYMSPIFRSAVAESGRMVVEFHAAQNLHSRDGKPLREFQVAGEDQVFHPANAVIVDNHIEVQSDDVPNPIAVRFAFSDTADANLVNGSDLPASPFRSDAFPLQSAGKDY